MWTETQTINITSFSLDHVHGVCEDVKSGEPCGLTGIYGHPEEHNKRKTWCLMEKLVECS